MIFILLLFFVISACKECNVLDDTEYTNGQWVKVKHSERSRWSPCARTLQLENPTQSRFACGESLHADIPAYRWTPHNCTLAAFNGTAFWEALEQRRLQFVGDSISAQAYYNVACELERQNASLQLRYYKVHDPRYALDKRHAAVIDFAHSPLLYEVGKDKHLDYSALNWPQYGSNGRKVVLVINTGAWYNEQKLTSMGLKKAKSAAQADQLFRDAMTALFNQTLAEFRGVVLFRAISPGHFDGCAGVTSPHFDWDRFDSRNHFVQQLTRTKNNFFFLDIENLSALRPDGHPGSVGGKDCYHWCSPGPYAVVNTWSDILFTALTQLARRGYPQVERKASEEEEKAKARESRKEQRKQQQQGEQQ